MERHAAACAVCGQLDTGVRRAMLVARNLPAIRLSSGFAASLDARLTAEAEAQRVARSRHRPPTARAVAVLAASLLAMAWLADRRPPVGMPVVEVALIDVPPVIAPEALPRPTVRSAPLRETLAVQVVSVRGADELSWTPAVLANSTGGSLTPTLIAARYAYMGGR